MTTKKALVVDDSPTIRNLVSFCMEQQGFEVVTAVDGLHALDELKVARFDVIITDINMPNMNGIELVKALRANEDTKAVPVLVLTILNTRDKKDEAKAAGANAWLEKPFEPEVLAKAVDLVISAGTKAKKEAAEDEQSA